MAEVLDYSAGWPRSLAWTKPTPGEAVGTVRYLGTPGRSKNIAKAELDYRLAHGTPTAFVHETTAGWMLGGWSAGAAAARADLADWTGNLGRTAAEFPGAYLADDVDTTTVQLAIIDDCLRGYASVAGAARTSVYGEYDVVEHCVGVSRTARLGWQTPAWSGRNPDGTPRVSAKAALYQHLGYVYPDGVEADRNTVLMDDWGQWPYEGGAVTSPSGWTAEDKAVVRALLDERLRGFVAALSSGDLNSVTGGSTTGLAGQIPQLRATADALVAKADAGLAGLAGSVAALAAQVAAIEAKLETMSVAGVDTAALVKAINDDAARRLEE